MRTQREPTPLQGGRRRRRRWPRLVLVLAAAATLALAALPLRPADEERPGTRAGAVRSPRATPLGPLEAAARPARPLPPSPPPYARLLAGEERRLTPRFERPPRAALVWDVRTGQVLYARDPERRLPIASLTKMMTALVVTDRTGPRELVTITRRAVDARGSAVGLRPAGRRLRAEPLLYGLLLASGNDTALALAQHVGGDVQGFVSLMNARARRMGLRCTRFSNPSGLGNRGNFSCPSDLAVIARDVLARPRLARIVRARDAALPFPIKGGRLYLSNHNPLLRTGYRGTDGVKTGFTGPAGRCLVATVRRGDRRLGVVLLRSPDPAGQARRLLDRALGRARR